MVEAGVDPFYCYGDNTSRFDEAYEDRAAFGTGPYKFLFEGWNNTNTSSERAAPLTYERLVPSVREVPAPAYSVVLPNGGLEEATRMVKYLIKHKYIDLHTKAVFVDLTVYNVRTRANPSALQLAIFRLLVACVDGA